MIKYENIWSQAEPEALRLKRSGYTPQQICTSIAKSHFGDTDKYNTVKGWHARRFPAEWPSTESKDGIKQARKPIRHVYTQPRLRSSIPDQPQNGYSLQSAPTVLVSQHPRDDFKCTPNSYVRQASANVKDPRHRQNGLQHEEYGDVPQLLNAVTVDTHYSEQIREHQAGGFIPQVQTKDFDTQHQLNSFFADFAKDLEGMDCLDGSLTLSIDDQQPDIRENDAAREPDLVSHSHNSNHLQNTNPLALASRSFQASPPWDFQRANCSPEGPHETEQPFAKYYGTKTLYDRPNPVPQYPLPPLPSMKIGVIHKGYSEKSWRPIGVKESKITTIDPDGFPTDHRQKRVKKGSYGREFRDSFALRELQHNTPNLAPQGSPAPEIMEFDTTAPQMMQIDTTPAPTVAYCDRTSKVSVHSDLRDSGYASVFDSAVDSMRSSFSSLNLAEDVNFKTDCREADDGFVDVKVKAKWRMRRSYLEKLRDAPLNVQSSENVAA